MSDRFKTMLDELKRKYDYVILDTVPFSIIADAGLINRNVDLTIYVIRDGKVDKRYLLDIDKMFKEEKIKVDRITGHGGLFKTPVVGQRVLAAALNSPISVMETAGEGGAWGIALLAGYLINNHRNLSLADYLEEVVFAGNTGVEIAPTAEDVEGFNRYIEVYKAGLAIEHAAVANKA